MAKKEEQEYIGFSGLKGLRRRDEEPDAPIPAPSIPPAGIPERHTEPAPIGTVPPAGIPISALPPASREANPDDDDTATEGFWQIDNWVSDVMLPRLGSNEQLVMFRIYRLTLGFNRDRCMVSYDRLAVRTKLSKNTVIQAAKQLIADRYIEARMVRTGKRGGQALEYRLLPASIPPTGIPTRGTPKSGIPKASTPKRGIPATGSMTIPKTQSEHAPVAPAPALDVFAVRTIGARLLEAHRGDVGFDHAKLRALVVNVLVGQGSAVDGSVVDEAIRGML